MCSQRSFSNRPLYFFDQTLFSRLDNKRDARNVSVRQRLHQDELAAYLLEKGTFCHFCQPSVADFHQVIPLFGGRSRVREIGETLSPAREPKGVLDQIKVEIGSYAFRAWYQQDSVPGESEFLSMQDLTLVDVCPDDRIFVRRVQSWDTAVNDGPRCDYPPIAEYDRTAQLRAAGEIAQLLQNAVNIGWMGDYSVMRDQARGCSTGAAP